MYVCSELSLVCAVCFECDGLSLYHLVHLMGHLLSASVITSPPLLGPCEPTPSFDEENLLSELVEESVSVTEVCEGS